MNTSRDAIYKQLFSHPEIVRDLVAGALPAAWAQALEVEAFERVNASYASEQGKARHEDVVWRARIGGEWVYVYILLEFQSRPDKWMALRMQVYIGLLYQDLIAQHKLSKHGKLPPVLPIVFYHGRRPWNAATELAELMLPPPDGLAQFQAQQQYLLIDQRHDNMRGDIVSLLLGLLRSSTETGMRAAAIAFAKRMKQPDLEPARTSLANWLLLTLQDDFGCTNLKIEEDFAMPPKRNLRFEEVFNDEFFAELKKGPEESRMQGVQEGIQQGERLTLQALLNDALVGLDMPAGVATKIADADSSQLRAWIKSLIGGASPRQVFAEG